MRRRGREEGGGRREGKGNGEGRRGGEGEGRSKQCLGGGRRRDYTPHMVAAKPPQTANPTKMENRSKMAPNKRT
jgi:hypothetical protein